MENIRGRKDGQPKDCARAVFRLSKGALTIWEDPAACSGIGLSVYIFAYWDMYSL